jgi:hypothetical protein
MSQSQLLFGKRSSRQNGSSPHERSRPEVTEKAEVSSDEYFETEPVRICKKNIFNELIYLLISGRHI